MTWNNNEDKMAQTAKWNKVNSLNLSTTKKIKVSNWFAVLWNLDKDVDIKKSWKTIKENTIISVKVNVDYYKLKQHKPYF
jgi:hypothetical protein